MKVLPSFLKLTSNNILVHGMSLVRFNEGSAYLLFTMLFQVYLRQLAIVKSLLMHIPIVCRLREK